MKNTKPRGNRIRAMRIRKNLSQQALADLIGVNQCMISTYESGETLPRMGTLFRLMEVLDCTADELYPRAGTEERSEAHGEAV